MQFNSMLDSGDQGLRWCPCQGSCGWSCAKTCTGCKGTCSTTCKGKVIKI